MGRSALPQLRPSQRLAELAERFRHAAAHDFADIPAWSGTTAYLYARLGQTTIARKFFDRLARRDFADVPRDTLWLHTMSSAAETSALLGDRNTAGILYNLLLPYADRIAVVDRAIMVKGSMAEFLAQLAHSLDRFQEAETHFERALDHHARLESPPLLVRTKARYARLLRDRGAAGDSGRAELLRREAEETAAALGLLTIDP